MKKIKLIHIVYLAYAGLLFLSLIFQQQNFVTVKQLKGYFEKPKQMELSWKSWISGEYQNLKEQNLKFDLKTRPDLTRVYNQVRYSLYHEISTQKVIWGKNGYLFEQAYLDAEFGLDFLGDSLIIEKLEMLKKITDTLATLNTKFLFVIAPGKAHVMHDVLPVEYDNMKKGETNYKSFIKYLDSFNIPLIDFNEYCLKMRDTFQYPVYPVRGIHWSVAVANFAMDTIIKKIEEIEGKDLPDYQYTSFKVSKKPKSTDHDIGTSMNLLWYKYEEEYLYPFVTFKQQDKYKPSVVFIADSYNWPLVNTGIQKQVFSSNNYWYYFKQNFNKQETEPDWIKEYSNLQQEIEKRDVIVFLSTDANLRLFGWDFVEKVYDMYFGQPIEN